jgi:plastocyanin
MIALRIGALTLAALMLAVPAAGAATIRVAVAAGGDERMAPAHVTATQGDTIVFAWEDDGHDLVLAGPEGTRVGLQQPGFQLTRVLGRTGSYTFLCTLHGGMQGTIAVAPDPAAAVPTVAPPVDVVVGPDGGRGLAPADVTVTPGQTVNWHWGRGGPGLTFADGAASGARSIGGFWGRAFTTAGTFAYGAGPGAAGTVTVAEPPAVPVVLAPQLAAAPAVTAALAAAPDPTRPALRGVRATLGPRRRSHTLRVTVSEDARLDVAMQALGRSPDLVARRTFTLYARGGTHTLQLPAMNLTARRYRLRIVAVDQAGNRSAARTLRVARNRS